MAKRFEPHLQKSDWEKELRNFQRQANETLTKCIARLKFIIESLHADRPKHEREILEHEILRDKLRKLVPSSVWRSVSQIEKIRLETAEPFCLTTELELLEKSYQDSKVDEDLTAGLHAMLGKRSGPPMESQVPPKRSNSPNQPSNLTTP